MWGGGSYNPTCGAVLAVPPQYVMVVESALSVFDCTRNADGVYILDADPAITCNEVRLR